MNPKQMPKVLRIDAKLTDGKLSYRFAERENLSRAEILGMLRMLEQAIMAKGKVDIKAQVSKL